MVQVQLLNHQADLDAHSGESSCDICIHFSQVGHGAVGSIHVVAPIQSKINLVVLCLESFATSLSYCLPQSRAPPVYSLI